MGASSAEGYGESRDEFAGSRARGCGRCHLLGSASARLGRGGAVQRLSRPRAETRRQLVSNVSTGFVGAALAWAILGVFPWSDWHSLVVGTPWVRVLGLAILICSTAFALWARVALGTMWSPSPSVKVQHQLRTDDPYGVARHPIYTGLLGMLLGTALLVGFGHWLVMLPVGLVLRTADT